MRERVSEFDELVRVLTSAGGRPTGGPGGGGPCTGFGSDFVFVSVSAVVAVVDGSSAFSIAVALSTLRLISST